MDSFLAWVDEPISFNALPKSHLNFSGETSRHLMQFSPPNLVTEEFVTPNAIFSAQRSAISRGFTNIHREPSLVSPKKEEINPAKKDDHEAQSPTVNGKKRNSRDFTFRPKKRNRSLTCNNPACHNRTFADEPNLSRHLREVHGQAQYHCPVQTCERHMRGFKRRDNCVNHQKRSHGALQSLPNTRGESKIPSSDSFIHITEDGDGASSPESEEREMEQKKTVDGSEKVIQKMNVLRALMKKRKRVEEEIDRAKAELQQALQRDVNREGQ